MKTPSSRQVFSIACIPVLSLLFIFSFKSSGAQEWQTTQQLVSVAGEMCEDPSIAVFNNNVYVVWQDERDGVSVQAYFRRSDNYGEGFHPGIRLSQADDINVSYCRVASWEDQVHVVWMGEDAASDHQIYYCHSLDAGENFSAPIQLTASASESFTPDIAVFDNSVHIVWVDLKLSPAVFGVHYKRSTDGGSTWSPEIPLGTSMTEGYVPRIELEGPTIYVSWLNLNVSPISTNFMLKKSTDNGENWSFMNVDYNTNAGVYLPHNDMCVFEDKLQFVWEDYRNGLTTQIYHGRSLDGGMTPEVENCMNTGGDEYKNPELGQFAEFIHCCWYNASKQIEYTRSLNQGQDWDPTILISDGAAVSESPDLAAFNDNVYAVWEQDNPSGYSEIWFRRTASDFGVDEDPNIAKNTPIQFQNYPNPVNDNTHFQFYLPHPSSASICIYNSAGKLIEKLGPYSLYSGEHKVEWNAAGNEPGIYYYQLLLDDEYSTVPLKKMIIL